jgi:tetratricopeptide (TPR) repeat protein
LTVALRVCNLQKASAEVTWDFYLCDLFEYVLQQVALSQQANSWAAASLAQLRTVVDLCAAALAWLDHPPFEQPIPSSQLLRTATLQYAFLHASSSLNVALLDPPTALGVLRDTFRLALQRPGLAAACAELHSPRLVQGAALQLGEALRCAGRVEDSLPPLELAAAAAAAGGDACTEAAALGTLSVVLLQRGGSEEDYARAEAAGRREILLLSSIDPSGVALQRAKSSLANVLVARSRAAMEHDAPDSAATLAVMAQQLAEEALSVAGLKRAGHPEAAEWAEVASSCHSLRGHLAMQKGALRQAVPHYEQALVAARGGSAPGSALPSSAAVAPLAMLERTMADLARAARAAGETEQAAADGAAAVRHRVALFAAVGQPLPSECAVCGEALAADDAGCDVALLRCLHAFHSPCITQWLGGRVSQGSCPVCRTWAVDARPEVVEEVGRQRRAAR